jgi:hypothetical protein
MKKIGFIILTVSMFLFFAIQIYADDVYTREGKRFIGTITEENEATLTIKTDEGTLLLNKADLMHVEKSTDEGAQTKENFLVRTVDNIKKMYYQLSNNNWFYVRKNIKKFHGKLFLALNKNRLYQLITNINAIDRFRTENYKSFVFAVYMVILLALGMIVSFVQNLVYKTYCKMRGIKPRYDT